MTGPRIFLFLALAACGARSRSIAGEDGIADGDSDADADGDSDEGSDSVPAGCDENPEGEGCPCDLPGPILCFEGPPETRGVGACGPGLRHCEAGVWGDCEGEGFPQEEWCNLADDDCDGLADDEVTNECGRCDGGCGTRTLGFGDGMDPFPIDGDDEGVASAVGGELVLADGFDRGRWVSIHALESGDDGWGCIAWEQSGEQVEISLRSAETLDGLADARPSYVDGGASAAPDAKLPFLQLTVDLVRVDDAEPTIIDLWVTREEVCE